MKKITQKTTLFLSALFVGCCMQITTAQPYQSIFGDSTTQFNVFVPLNGVKTAFDDYDEELGEGYTEHIFFTKGNDTIIDGQIYQIAKNIGVDIDGYAYVREDTLTGKIYSYLPQFNEEILVCDFSLIVGDTFYLPKIKSDYYDKYCDGYMVVDSLSDLDGRKVIYFGNIFVDCGSWNENYPSINPDKFYFREGIGSVFGPIDYQYCNGGMGLKKLLCVHQDENLVYIRNPESSYQCDYKFADGIDEHSKNELNVYPNPVTDQLTIKNDEFKITHIQIIDIMGRVVKNIVLKNESKIIVNMSALHSGLYLIKANMNGSIVTEKIVKL